MSVEHGEQVASVLDGVVGDNHRLGAYAEREKYERNEGVDDV